MGTGDKAAGWMNRGGLLVQDLRFARRPVRVFGKQNAIGFYDDERVTHGDLFSDLALARLCSLPS